jgi:hypothetical protein
MKQGKGNWQNIWLDNKQYHFNAWARWAVARGPIEHRDPVPIYVCCVQHTFKCLNTDFVGSTNTINIFFISSTIYILFPVSGCVGRGPSTLLCMGAYNAVKTALTISLNQSICLWKRKWCLNEYETNRSKDN